MKAHILNASAGSGKTYQLAYKYVHDVVKQPTLYRHILAVTFTNKATEEMKTRILKEIHLLASGKKSDYLDQLCRETGFDAATVRKRAAEARARILHDYSRFTVLTIDTFFQRILRAFIKELGIDLNYNVEIETAPLLSKSADALIEQITVDPDLLRWLTGFAQERIDEGSGWDIRSGILALGQELFKERNKDTIARIGSKEELERVVKELTARGEAAKKQMQEAAREALDWMEEAGIREEDLSYKIPFPYLRQTASGDIRMYNDAIRKRLSSDKGWCNAKSPAKCHIPKMQEYLQKVCSIYDQNVRHWNTCKLLRENYRGFALLADLRGKMQQMCDEQNLMLLPETKYILSEFIGHNDAPFIYEKVGNRFERFMIDEFQDTSSKEWENFLPLLRNAMSQEEETSVFIVGDIKQSIYRWRGGDWKILHQGAREALGSSETKTISLQDNYRSLPVVVDFNNRIIEQVVATDNRILNSMLEHAREQGAMSAPHADELRDILQDAYRNHAQNARRKAPHPGYVSVELFDEQPPVIQRICELIDRGFRPCQILILVRRTSESSRLAAELLEFKRTNTDERYRFDVMTQEALIIGSAPISIFVTAAMRLALNNEDSISLANYNHFLGQDFDTPLPEEAKTFFRSIQTLSPEEAFEQIVMYHGLQQAEHQTAYLQAIHDQILSFCANRIADIPLFLRWWDEQGALQSLSIERSESAIEITTIHKAKGLERAAVIIPHCAWKLAPLTSSGRISNIVWADANETATDDLGIGRFPVKFGNTMADSDFSAEYYREQVYSHVDNINLLYVALTRAAESLHIFIPRKGTLPNKEKNDTPSHVGALLWRSLQAAAESDTPILHRVEQEGIERYESGEFSAPLPPKRKEDDLLTPRQEILHQYATSKAKMNLRLSTQRYLEEGEQELSPQNFGILMHKAFQEALTIEDIRQSISRMHGDALISPEEAEKLEQKVDQALENPLVRGWFENDWDCVRNENSIILPHGDQEWMQEFEKNRAVSLTKRPDRVMTRSDRAVVVDYKFGKRKKWKDPNGEEHDYREQVKFYLELLRRMGYRQCVGYLWYVKLGEVETIEL